MKRLRLLQLGAALLACLAMVVPTPFLDAQTPEASAQPSRGAAPSAVHVALQPGGTLVGQVLDSQGRPLARTPVALRQSGREVASTATDERGGFAVGGLRGGTYQIATDRSAGVYHLWAANTAPGFARPEALLVEGGVQVRGQGALCCALSNPWVLAGIVTAAIAVPIIINNTKGESPHSP